MIKTINNKLIKYTIQHPYYLGDAMIKYISNGIQKNMTHGVLYAKASHSKIGEWNLLSNCSSYIDYYYQEGLKD